MTTPDPAYLSCSLAWSLCALVIGYATGFIVGRATQKLEATKEAEVSDTQPTPPPKRDYLAFLDVVQTRGFGAIIFVLAVATMAVAGYTLTKQGDLLDCQTAYNQAYSNALQQRTEAAAADRVATRDMVATIAGIESVPAADRREVYQNALATFLTRTKTADAQRMANPLPSARCS